MAETPPPATEGRDTSTRGWLIDGLAWEIENLIIGVPIFIIFSLLAWKVSWSKTELLVAFLVAAVAFRFGSWLWHRVRSSS